MKFGLSDTVSDMFAVIAGNFIKADLSIFHEFAPAPAGGGHQFLRGFVREAEAKGVHVENNRVSRETRACLFNSFNFSETRLLRTHRKSVLYVHRVDGPIDVYRGRKDGVDKHIHSISKKVAAKTIFQSQYSLEKHLELGMDFPKPEVILNAADPAIFHSHGRIPFLRNRKTRLIATSWSDNPNKGSVVYKWLDENLDWNRFDFTFVGRSQIQFKNIHMLLPVDSYRLANLLREHDIYITASKHDPCSNSLIEALTCGLPAVYLQSGGHPEIVKQAGVGFEAAEQIPAALDQVVDSYEAFQSQISIQSMWEVAESYLKVLELL